MKMGLWHRLGYFLDYIRYIAALIDEWNPSGCTSEKDCENSLFSFLHESLFDKQIVRQYGRGRARVDLMVDDKVMIEIKFNLTSTSEYQRLVGQMVEYAEWKKTFFLIL